MSKLDEILEPAYFIVMESGGRFNTEAKQQIKDLILELIGKREDETGHDNRRINQNISRNILRHELRKKVEAL